MLRKIDALQIVRCYAAVMVAICHIWNDGWLPKIIVDLGGFGVDLFFVLSGFIMCLTVNLHQKTRATNALHFLKKRVCRIFPIYLICVIPLLLFNIKAEGLKNLYFYVGNLLLLPSFNNDPAYALVLGPGWSLVYEMLFYSLFAVFLLFLKDKNKLLMGLGFSLIALVIFMSSFGLQGPQLGWVNFSYIIGDPMMINFALGIAAYFIYLKLHAKITLNLGFSIGCLFLFSAVAALLYGYLEFHRFIAYGIPSLIIVCIFTLTKNAAPENALLKKVVLVGDASYSVYLIHYYSVFFKPKVMLLERFLPLSREVFLNIADVLLLAAAVIGGVIFYKIVEQPIIRFFNVKNTRNHLP